MITLGQETCTHFKTSSSREWLETNGIGGFAMGTVSGANTRRYHGLLTAATAPPLGRIRAVSKFEETLVIDGERYELSANRFPDVVHPEGFRHITSFRLDPFPIWTYRVGDIEIEKRVFMVHGANATVCRWRMSNIADGADVRLELRPLISLVDYHHLQHEDGKFDPSFSTGGSWISLRPYSDMPEIFFAHNAAEIEPGGDWYRDFEYAVELERGFDHREDLFQPFVLKFNLSSSADVIISTDVAVRDRADKLERREIKRRNSLIEKAGANDEFASQLVLAADQFVVARGSGSTIIAGYPWFSDWGRDTMISLAGLTLATKRPKIAKSIILEFSKHISQGMLPNRFPDAGEEAEYNTVDATLWYFEAVRAYLDATGDIAFVRKQIYPKLDEIVIWHLRGTLYNIHVDTDGLLYAGEPGVQLTWMDAKIGDLVITPRTGKPVEIQALWFNALMIMTDLARRLGDSENAAKYKAMADLAKLSFNALFWNEEQDCLYDVVNHGERDESIRPNQIFAASLFYSMLDAERARFVVDKVEAELLTPVGLRSLARSDAQYVPYYTGTPFERDSAYHQGTVWPWLIGAFIDAYRRVYPERTEKIAAILDGFRGRLSEAALGQVSEIFDAEPPFSPRGCPAQAWSVAELRRVMSRT